MISNTVSSSSLAYITVQPIVDDGSQSGRFWARSTASVHDSLKESRLFCTVFMQDIPGHSSSVFQYTEGEEVKICSASALSSNKARRWCLDNFWKHNRTDFVLHTTKLTCTSKDYSTRGFWIHFLSFDCRWHPTNLSFPKSTKPSETTREICNITST